MAETGTSVGEISGQSKSINSCDFRPARPFRIVTGCEDNTIGVFEGPPFKFKMTKQVIFLSACVQACVSVTSNYFDTALPLVGMRDFFKNLFFNRSHSSV
jgi:hypothetical protein